MNKSELAHRIASAALLRGTFTLRSGRTSNFYLDKYLFSTQPDVLAELGKLFAVSIAKGTTRLAGAELGGIPLVSAASMASGLPCVFIRNQKKEYGTAKQLEGVLVAGDKVVIQPQGVSDFMHYQIYNRLPNEFRIFIERVIAG